MKIYLWILHVVGLLLGLLLGFDGSKGTGVAAGVLGIISAVSLLGLVWLHSTPAPKKPSN